MATGAVSLWNNAVQEYYTSIFEAAKKHYGLPAGASKPLSEYSEAEMDLLAYGVDSKAFSKHAPGIKPPKTAAKGKFEGILTGMWRRYQEKGGESSEAAYFIPTLCTDCHGDRLKQETRTVVVCGNTLPQLSTISLHDLSDWITHTQKHFTASDDSLLNSVLYDLKTKVNRILHVGLGYLSLDRNSVTLSGGESQRLRLASILGSGLTGVLYLLDEPTAGLHPKDTDGLIHIMKQLRDLGNTVLVIEHDQHVIAEADHVIDIGPGAGRFGGEIVGQGTLEQLKSQPESITGTYLKEAKQLLGSNRSGNGNWVKIVEASKHNLKNITTAIPLQTLVSISGVSGSGKSTLVFDVLAQAKEDHIDGCKRIEGIEQIDSIIQVGQTPISRMQRSNIATFMDLFTQLRKVFASQSTAKAAGLTAKSFSFNTPGAGVIAVKALVLLI